jgi:hypothetical protein
MACLRKLSVSGYVTYRLEVELYMSYEVKIIRKEAVMMYKEEHHSIMAREPDKNHDSRCTKNLSNRRLQRLVRRPALYVGTDVRIILKRISTNSGVNV